MSQIPKRNNLDEQPSTMLRFPQPTLRLIYDTAPIGLAFLSPDCRYLQINQRLTELCGISIEDHIGRFVRDCVPALADSIEAIVRSIMETGEPVIGIEVAGQRVDQSEERFWITYWHPQRGPAGDIIGVNIAAEEITERKRSERELRSAKEAAEVALHNLRDTQASLIEAEKLAALGRLVAGVAHEISTPVGTSLTVASSLEQKSAAFSIRVARGDLKRSNLNEFLKVVADASSQLLANLNRAAELIQSFKQVAVDRSYLDRRTFELGEFIEQVLVNLRPTMRKNHLTLNVDCPPALVMHSYSGPIGQVLTNLLLNSVAHAFPNGKGGEVGITARASGSEHVELLISDNGCGMGIELKRQAFDPFFTTRRNEGSTGLGLHIVHNIVTNRLGGSLTLDSRPGEGTRIQLILPLRAPEMVTSK